MRKRFKDRKWEEIHRQAKRKREEAKEKTEAEVRDLKD